MIRLRSALWICWHALLASALLGCADESESDIGLAIQASALPASDLAAIQLSVFGDDGTCDPVTGSATGTPLAGLSNLSIAIDVANEIKVKQGSRVFYAVSRNTRGRISAKACATMTVTADPIDVPLRLVPQPFGYVMEGPTSATYVPLSNPNVVASPQGMGGDEGNWPLQFGFDFPYFGVGQAGLNVHANLFTSFGVAMNTANNECTFEGKFEDDQTPQNVVALLWDDAVARADGQVLSKLDGVAPNRTFTVEWRNWDFVESRSMGTIVGSGFCSGQRIVFHEDGQIDFEYGPRQCMGGSVAGCRARGCQASIGIKGGSQAQSMMYRCNQTNGSIDSGQRIVFRPTR